MDKDVFKAFEETIRRNVMTAVEYSNETRRLFRELEIKIQTLQNIILSRDGEIATIKQQLANIQTILFAKGTVYGDNS